MSSTGNNPAVVSALEARANFGKLLDHVSEERRSLVIEKRGAPRAVPARAGGTGLTGAVRAPGYVADVYRTE